MGDGNTLAPAVRPPPARPTDAAAGCFPGAGWQHSAPSPIEARTASHAPPHLRAPAETARHGLSIRWNKGISQGRVYRHHPDFRLQLRTARLDELQWPAHMHRAEPGALRAAGHHLRRQRADHLRAVRPARARGAEHGPGTQAVQLRHRRDGWRGEHDADQRQPADVQPPGDGHPGCAGGGNGIESRGRAKPHQQLPGRQWYRARQCHHLVGRPHQPGRHARRQRHDAGRPGQYAAATCMVRTRP